jgi:hypothetical protein
MPDWQPIETMPENTLALVFCPTNEQFPYCVDQFQWVDERYWEVVSESAGESGARRQIQEERTSKERAWDNSWGAEYWMPLPEPPTQP